MKPRVLMIAYACDPIGSGEHWLGWGWAQQAAKRYQVDLITTPRARAALEQASPAAGISLHFVEVSGKLRQVSEAVGANWWRKLAWQKRVARMAAQLHSQEPFQLVHQTTFHSFRVPFLAACSLNIPSVWGPIAGGERVPQGFGRYLGPAKYSEQLRNIVNRLWLHLPAIRRSLARASIIFVSNGITQQFLPAQHQAKCRVVPPNALRPEDEHYARPSANIRADNSPFRLLYVGNCVPTRAVPLVFEALHNSGIGSYEFSIIGDGPAIPAWKQTASKMNLQDKVKFLGKVAYDKLSGFYAASDVLVFPALRDSGGSALLEAMARFVPVVCLDWGGPAEMVNGNSGIKAPVSEPRATVSSLALALLGLSRDPARRSAIAAAARARALSLFRWEAKGQLLQETYERLLRDR